MSSSMTYSEVRYLRAKKTVDDRALNVRVLDALRDLLRPPRKRPLRVLELGAGVGTMVTRLLDWHVLESAEYTLLDRDAASLAAARDHLLAQTKDCALTPSGVRVSHRDVQLEVEFVEREALDFLTDPANQQRFDLVLANAVLDLMDLQAALERIWGALDSQASFWFTINFDGETIFLPEAKLDAPILELYNRTMDQRVRDGEPCGDSKAGRHLLELIPKTSGTIVAAGSSDWVVFPRAGVYPEDESYFLHHIVNTIWTALSRHPQLERTHPELTSGTFEQWISARRQQIDRAELVYIAHQIDVVGRAPARSVRRPGTSKLP